MRVLAILLLLVSSGAAAQSAHVQRIIDGDTLVTCTQICETVRIANIDAPEMPPKSKCEKEAQLALDAKALLARLTDGRTVELIPEARSRDRYGRLLATVRVGGKDVGDALIAAGVARRWSGRREPWC